MRYSLLFILILGCTRDMGHYIGFPETTPGTAIFVSTPQKNTEAYTTVAHWLKTNLPKQGYKLASSKNKASHILAIQLSKKKTTYGLHLDVQTRDGKTCFRMNTHITSLEKTRLPTLLDSLQNKIFRTMTKYVPV